jgi:hypothetical protein
MHGGYPVLPRRYSYKVKCALYTSKLNITHFTQINQIVGEQQKWDEEERTRRRTAQMTVEMMKL